MSGLVQIGTQSTKAVAAGSPILRLHSMLWLQWITITWMLVECGLSLYAAATAHSPALLAFGSDSLVELLSASVVLLQFGSAPWISQRTAGRIASILLFVLAAIVATVAIASQVFHLQPESSCIGITVTVAALIAMPILAAFKRREAVRTGNVALAADAVQSATCAYLALVTLVGLGVNSLFHLPWFDSLAALAAIPLLIFEGRSAWRGHTCGCC
jgi:divalent metal cation (Fe/Co/Zn/Cd) transporter